MNQKTDPAVLNTIEAMRREGKGYLEIADSTGVSIDWLHQLAHNNGLTHPGKPSFWNPERTAMAVQMVKDGFSASQIGSRLGCSRNAVIGRLHRLQVTWKRPDRPAGWLPKKQRPPPPKGVQRVFQSREAKVEDKAEREEPGIRDLPEEPTSSSWVFFRDMESHHCRWPTAGEPGPMMRCCGATKTQPHVAYCEFHYNRAHQFR